MRTPALDHPQLRPRPHDRPLKLAALGKKGIERRLSFAILR